MMPSRDANIVSKPKPQSPQLDTRPITTAATDWSGWERWLKGHLSIELNTLHRALGQLLAEERRRFGGQLERKTNALELRLAKLSGAIDVLRGAQPPPLPKFPRVKAWSEDTIYFEGDIVTFAGGTYQATKNTARAPGTQQDWVCLAASGKSLTVRGTYESDVEYRQLNVVMVGGSSFVALKDAPGSCPGDDWHLLCSRGSRGHRGDNGERGLMGLRGERGAAAPTIQSWCIDRTRYTATPIMSDGSIGPSLELRGLFEQFFSETANERS
jgi:hypothetical protein